MTKYRQLLGASRRFGGDLVYGEVSFFVLRHDIRIKTFVVVAASSQGKGTSAWWRDGLSGKKGEEAFTVLGRAFKKL